MGDRSGSRRGYLWRKGWRRCFWCGTRLTRNSLTCEHLLPRSKGGTDKRANLVAACGACNSARSSNEWAPHPDVLSWAVQRGLIAAMPKE